MTGHERLAAGLLSGEAGYLALLACFEGPSSPIGEAGLLGELARLGR